MAEPMISFRARWMLGVGVTAAAAGLYWTADATLMNTLRPAPLVSGLVLLTLIVLLALFNARKKLPFLPLINASAWMQIHVYAGLFSMFLFLLHTGFRLPRGPLETVLAALFFIVSLSGIAGLAISRWVPARLTLHGENVMFERIPALRSNLKREVEALALASVPDTRSTTIADFYEQRLRAYFERPRNLWSHLVGYARPLHSLLAEVDTMDRYFDTKERQLMARIVELIRLKENLDFQLAAQGLVKLWLFVHIPLTYGLIVVGLIHGLLAWNFS